MEYVYAAMLLHKAGQKVDENNVKKVLESAHVKVDEARVKALVAALEGVNIDEAIEKASVAQVVAAAPSSHGEAKHEAKADHAKKAADEKKIRGTGCSWIGSFIRLNVFFNSFLCLNKRKS